MIVTFSGIDGSGKTSMTGAVAKRLREMGYDAEACKPRYLANQTMMDFCEYEFGDRYLYYPKLDPTMYVYGVIVDWIDFLALKLRRHDGRVLVCDRWFLWDVLSQAVQYGVDLTPILDLSVKFPAPDVSFFLRATPENAHGRLLLRETPKIHCNETLECLKRLTTAFEEVRRLTAWRPCVVETDGRGFDAVLDSVMGIVLGAIEDDRRGEMKNAPAIRARSRMRRPT